MAAAQLVWPFPTRNATQYQRVDQGWDLQGPMGPVVAAASGTVQYAHDPSGFGTTYPVLILDTPSPYGIGIYYGHVVPTVAAGTRVSAGQPIATTANGPQGNATSPGWLEIGWWGPNGPTGNGTAMHQALSSGQMVTGSVSVGGAADVIPLVPGLNDIPKLDAYIRKNYPDQSWMLDVAEVKGVLEQAIGGPGGPETPAQIQAAIQNTARWKHTSQAMIKFTNLAHTSPEELNFGDPGSQASQALAKVHTAAGNIGLGLPLTVLKNVALDSLKYGWSDAQIQQRLGGLVTVGASRDGTAVTNDPQMLATLDQLAGKYLYNPSAGILQQYAQQVAAGTMSPAAFQAFLASTAATKYPSMAEAITAGQAPSDIIDPLRQAAAQTMGVPANSINFVSDPMYSKVLNYTPPAVAGKAQAPRVMTTSEMQTYLRNTDQYAHTQPARDTAAQMEAAITRTFGKVAP